MSASTAAKTEDSSKTKKHICTMIGFAILILFWISPPIEPLTGVGMKVAGAFLSMIFLWSTVEILWPSLFGLFFIALSGYGGEGAKGFKTVFSAAFSNDTVLLVMFAMILFGAMGISGVPKYVANWVLTRKVINGRPYVFITCVFVTGFVLAAFSSAVASMIILLPIAVKLMETLNINRDDKLWPYFFVGIFMSINFGRPFLPFKGAVSGILSTFTELTGISSDMLFLKYMIMITTFGAFFIALYVFMLKFIIRPDVSKLKDVTAEQLENKELEPINFGQKVFLIMIPLYVFMLVLPSYLPKTIPGIKFLNTIGPVGISVFWIILLSVIHFNGKSLLNFKAVASKQFNWGVFFMIPSAIYGASALSSDAVGFKALLVNILSPIIEGRSELIFVAIIFTIGLLVSNIANNTSMALVLLPVILVFCEQMGTSATPVVMGMFAIVFAAMLTPGASPQTALMFGNSDIYSPKDILKIGIPATAVILLVYIFIGYPFLKILFAGI